MHAFSHKVMRPFILAVICLLMLIDIFFTIHINNHYQNETYKKMLKKVTSVAIVFLETDDFDLNAQHRTFFSLRLKVISSEDAQYTLTSEALFPDKIKPKPLQKVKHYAEFDIPKLYQSIKNNLRKNGKYHQLSILLNPQGGWLNIRIKAESYPYTYAASLLIELILLLTMLLYIVAAQRFVKPWRRLQTLANRLGVPLAGRHIPIFGPSIAKGAVKSMNQMIDHIEKLDREKANTLIAISHDLRTPLTRAKLYLETKFSHEDRHHFLEKNLNEIEALLEQIQHFVQGKRLKEPFENLDLISFVESICHDYIDIGEPVSFYTNASVRSISVQPHALKRALINVIDNAIKYGAYSEVHLILSNKQAVLLIKDRGKGIPKSEQENVFKPFYRIDSDRSSVISGSGLGLSIAKDILKAQGANISIHNRKDEPGLMVKIIWHYT